MGDGMPPPPPRGFAAPGPSHIVSKRPAPPPKFDGTPSAKTPPVAAPAPAETDRPPAVEVAQVPEQVAAPGIEKLGDEVRAAPPAQSESESDAKEIADAAAKAKSVPEYTPPGWSGPAGVPYRLEVLKMGSVVEDIDVATQAFYTFGRHPSCNVVLEHPSCSRLHAVLQFNDTGEAFLWDAGSSHGTFMNKRRLKSNVFAPLRVGDQFKFGQSSRIYIFSGPQELLPEEGLSRAEKQQLRKLEALASAQEEAAVRQMEVAKAMMHQREAGGATWGQDFSEADDYAQQVRTGPEFDWRTFSGKMNEKQEKMKEKLAKKDLSITNLRSEIQRIQAKKDSQDGGLTSGQEMQVGRNEQRIEQLEEEIENLAEQFEESVMDGAVKRAGGDGPAQKRKKAPAEDEEEIDSDGDEFYDRTGAKAKKAKVVIATQAPKDKQAAETIDGLWEKHRIAEAERAGLAVKLEAAEAVERRDQVLEEQAAAQAAQGESDALDAFMTSVSHNLDKDTVASLRGAVAEADAQIKRLERLIKIADPMGNYKGPKVPKAKPAAQPAPAQGAADGAVPAADGNRPEPIPGGGAAQRSESLSAAALDIRKDGGEASVSAAAAAPDDDGFLNPEALKARLAKEKAQAAAGVRSGPAAAAGRGRGAQVQIPKRGGHLAMRERPKTDEELAAAAQAKVSADLQMLARAREGGGRRDDEMDGDEEQRGAEWVPPQDQRGDGSGRTALHERLGY